MTAAPAPPPPDAPTNCPRCMSPDTFATLSHVWECTRCGHCWIGADVPSPVSERLSTLLTINTQVERPHAGTTALFKALRQALEESRQQATDGLALLDKANGERDASYRNVNRIQVGILAMIANELYVAEQQARAAEADGGSAAFFQGKIAVCMALIQRLNMLFGYNLQVK